MSDAVVNALSSPGYSSTVVGLTTGALTATLTGASGFGLGVTGSASATTEYSSASALSCEAVFSYSTLSAALRSSSVSAPDITRLFFLDLTVLSPFYTTEAGLITIFLAGLDFIIAFYLAIRSLIWSVPKFSSFS